MTDIVKITDTSIDVKSIVNDISKKAEGLYNKEVENDIEFIKGISYKKDIHSPLIMGKMSVPRSKKSGFASKILNKILTKMYYVVYNSVHGALSQQQSFNEYILEVVRNLESHKSANSLNTTLDFEYLAFENIHRGSFEDVWEKQKGYLSYFKPGGVVLDIGCGRGEFLQLLKDNEFMALGIDVDKDMINLCTDRGLLAYEQDAVQFLDEYKGDLNGIFAGQVIEHMPYSEIIKLVDVAYKRLNDEGVLIMETPNVQTLMAHIGHFYADPSHITFVHPDTIKFVCESAGFKNIEIKFLSKCPESDWYDEISKDKNFTDTEKKYYQRLNDVIFGYRDFSVIARK